MSVGPERKLVPVSVTARPVATQLVVEAQKRIFSALLQSTKPTPEKMPGAANCDGEQALPAAVSNTLAVMYTLQLVRA
jgi:hypothetical protein